MRHEEDRRAQGPLDLLQLALQLRAHDRIEGTERLVHQQDVRAIGQRPGYAHALTLAARQLSGVAISHLEIQAHQRQELERALAGGLLCGPLQARDGRDIVGNASVGEEAALL